VGASGYEVCRREVRDGQDLAGSTSGSEDRLLHFVPHGGTSRTRLGGGCLMCLARFEVILRLGLPAGCVVRSSFDCIKLGIENRPGADRVSLDVKERQGRLARLLMSKAMPPSKDLVPCCDRFRSIGHRRGEVVLVVVPKPAEGPTELIDFDAAEEAAGSDSGETGQGLVVVSASPLVDHPLDQRLELGVCDGGDVLRKDRLYLSNRAFPPSSPIATTRALRSVASSGGASRLLLAS
jgi:hypothetical protein